MRNTSGKICTQNKNTRFMFNNVFPKIVLFMNLCEEIWWRYTGHRL